MGHARIRLAIFYQAVFNPATFQSEFHFSRHFDRRLTYIRVRCDINIFGRSGEPAAEYLLATVLVCLVTGVLSSLEVIGLSSCGARSHSRGAGGIRVSAGGQAGGGFFLFQLAELHDFDRQYRSGWRASWRSGCLMGWGRNRRAAAGIFRQEFDPKRHHPAKQAVNVDRSDRAGGLVFFFVRARAEMAHFGAFIGVHGVNACGHLCVTFCVRSANPFGRYSGRCSALENLRLTFSGI